MSIYFKAWDILTMEIGARASWHLYLENTGTEYHRLRAVKKEHK